MVGRAGLWHDGPRLGPRHDGWRARGPGMMGGYGYAAPGTVQPGGAPLTMAQAKVVAQQFLNAQFAGTKTDEALTFPGYYTIDVARNGQPIGMLSVNAHTGAVWYHAWHGTFLQEKDLD